MTGVSSICTVVLAVCLCACGGGGGGGGFADSGTGGTGTGGTGGGSALPQYVNVELISAIVGPGKSDGTQWDGFGTVPNEVWSSLATALGVPGVESILAFIASGAVQALEKPDPFGGAEINPFGTGFDPAYNLTLATISTNTEDTFQPTWPPPFPGWVGVTFAPGLAVRVTLYEEDLSDDDDLGVATITYDDLVDAWNADGTYWVRVAGQTNDQLLAFGVQVTTGAPNP